MNSRVSAATTDGDAGGQRSADSTGLLHPRPLPARFSTGYSRFVNMTKMVLPLVAAALLVALVAWPQLRQQAESFRLDFANMPGVDADAMAMTKPRYTGFDSDNRPYTITADTASQLDREPSQVALEQLQADMTMSDGAWLALQSSFGVYDRDAEVLDLIGGVDLFHDRGYEIRTESASVNLGAGTVSGDDSVVGQGPFGDLRAEGFRISDNGKRVRLTGHSRILIRPGAELPAR
ncbi:MAG: LPS export ABC transporter periplasmic protein LptC [Acetobacterales bacterium]